MLYPMFVLVLFTLAVAGYLLSLRIKAVKSGQLRLSYFRTYRTAPKSGTAPQQGQSAPELVNGAQEPDQMIQASRNYANLLEMPVLFYAAGCASLALDIETTAMLILAWLYVAARIAHSYVHLTFNNVVTRLQVFLFSTLCLLTIWVLLILAQLKR